MTSSSKIENDAKRMTISSTGLLKFLIPVEITLNMVFFIVRKKFFISFRFA